MRKVSIIIPVYNCSKFITEAIDSALMQTYKDYEIIVVDDGSTDNTKEIIGHYLNKVTYIYQDNRGPAAARNMGISKSKGEYIAFLDADDIWNPHKLEFQIQYLNDNPQVGLVCSDAEMFSSSCILEGTKLGKITVPHSLTFEKLLRQNYIQTLTVMVKRECIEKVGPFDESKELFFVEDYDLWLRIARYYGIGYINQPLAKYRFHPQNCSSNVIRMGTSLLILLNKICNKWPEIKCKYKHIIKMVKANLFFEMGYYRFSRNELLVSRKYFLTSLCFNCFNIKTYKYLFFSFFPHILIKQIKVLSKK